MSTYLIVVAVLGAGDYMRDTTTRKNVSFALPVDSLPSTVGEIKPKYCPYHGQ